MNTPDLPQAHHKQFQSINTVAGSLLMLSHNIPTIYSKQNMRIQQFHKKDGYF